MGEKRWLFVDNQNANFDGLNDAGIETFSANRIKSLVREVGQNAIDAKRSDVDGPVKVVFESFKISPNQFTGKKQFLEILKKCKESSLNNFTSNKFFEDAIKIFEDEIDVLRISDFNTTGLKGAKSGLRGTDWHSLVKERGSSNKNLTSGGSFGIGKAAPIGCSDLRTVIYSSLDCEEYKHSYVGVSQLISFEREPNIWTVGRGYYSDNDKMNAIMEEFSFNGYKREETGTDIYILGFLKEQDLKDKIIEAVIENFLVSIWTEKLVVEFDDVLINKDTLGTYVDKLNLQIFNDIHKYYYLLTHTNKNIKVIDLNSKIFGEQYGFSNGECKLLLLEGEDLNRKILMTRSAGMKIFEQDRIHSSISFTGILMITGEEMNKVFKEMEMPSHDSWQPGRCRENSRLYTKCYKELRQYLKKQVIDSFGDNLGTEVDAFGLEDLLYTMNQEDGSEVEEVLQCKTIDLSQTIKTPVETSSIGPKEIVKRPKQTNRNLNDSENDNDPNGEDIGEFGSAGENETNINDGDGGANSGSGDGLKGGKSANPVAGGNASDLRKESETSYKPVLIKMRMYSPENNSGKYTLKFMATKKSKKGRLEFILSGEQSTDTPNLINVKFKNSEIKVDRLENNILWFSGLKTLKEVELEVEFNFKQYCMWEVKYCESKK